jgi:hypothetical protein
VVFRVLLYLVFFYVVWKILQSVIGRGQWQKPPKDRAQQPRDYPKDLSKIQDAEFEDITQKEDPGGPKAAP